MTAQMFKLIKWQHATNGALVISVGVGAGNVQKPVELVSWDSGNVKAQRAGQKI